MLEQEKHYGPNLKISEWIHSTKYRGKGETFKEAMSRVASTLSDSGEHYHQFRQILLDMRFLPAGRIQTAVGSPRQTTPYNCLSGDTKILTQEYGSVAIKDVAGQNVHLLDGNRNWVKCPVLYHGKQTTVELEFKGNWESTKIRSTLEHGWVKANKHSIILTKAFTNPSGKIDIDDLRPSKFIHYYDEYELGIIHGIIYGDGSNNGDDSYKIRVCSHHESITPYLNRFKFSTPPSSNGDPVYYIPKSFTKRNLKQLPNSFNKDYLLGFLRGWFAADGCVSTQPEATICGDIEEENWLIKWGPLVGWHVTGSTLLAQVTNFGRRNKGSSNIRIRKSSLNANDFLILQHRQRWGEYDPLHSWRVHGEYSNPVEEDVYCPVVPTTHSFALSSGIHSRNCFVSGIIEDSMEDIMDKAKEDATTMRLGGGIGYDFSTLRPRGDLIKSLDSKSSGPISFMEIFNAVCGTVRSAGHRRGAEMGVLRVDHPDIEEFIASKTNDYNLTNFNISVAITDEFIEAVKTNSNFNLRFDGRVYRTINAVNLWEKILRATWEWAEPGVLFIDRMNKKNNLWYCENITTTNPCSEQPLPPYGACLLGSFNLVKYIDWTATDQEPFFDREQFKHDIVNVVRAMDNVIDVAIYPLPQQEENAKSKRRMGLGVTGVANAIEAMGFSYGSEGFLRTLSEIMQTLRDTAYRTSISLAIEKGPFPLYDNRYLDSDFAKTLPDNIRELISKFGIRNSHLLSVAPTGTISLSADNISSGIEPVFSLEYTRDIQTFDGSERVVVKDYGYDRLSVVGKTADKVSVKEHVDVLITASKYVDSACSKTCNVGDSVTWEEFKNVYMQAYEGGASGCTTFRAAGKRFGILNASADEEEVIIETPETGDFISESESGGACYYDASTGLRSCE